jgi:nicotinamidase-related amidase
VEALPNDATLLVIDVQKGFDAPERGRWSSSDADANIARVLAGWRHTQRPVILVQHASVLPGSSLHPSHPGFDFKDVVRPAPGELVVRKQVNSAFIGTDLEAELRRRNVGTLVIIGLTTPHCVSATARMAGNLGFETYVVSDATAASEGSINLEWNYGGRGEYSPEVVHEVSLGTLHGEFASVVATNEVLAALGAEG